MSQASDRLSLGREKVRERFRKIRRSQGSMLGIAEIIGLVVAAFMLLATIVGYFYFLVPARSRAAALVVERERLMTHLQDARLEVREGLGTKERLEKITESLQAFEESGLNDRDRGRMVLYEDINELIRKNGLRNTSGPAYTSLEPLGMKVPGQPGATTTSATSVNKWQSLYPGIAVGVTVEGQYQQIRHFVRDIENNREFIIINAVELERATESKFQPAVEPGSPKSDSGSALVSLRMELAVYFRRAPQADRSASTTVTR